MRAEIFVPSPMMFIVQIDGVTVGNYRELVEEARQEVEAEYVRRWEDYRCENVAVSIAAAQGDREALTRVVSTPEMYYRCSEELAAKAEIGV